MNAHLMKRNTKARKSAGSA